MNIFQALFLGIVQGLTEFLPISSSAHLVVIPWLFKWSQHPLSFDIMLHTGTFVALFIYFGKYWLRLIAQGILGIKKRGFKGLPEARLFWLIILACLPVVLVGTAFETKATTVLRNPVLIGLTMAGFAILFFMVDTWSRKNKTLYEINVFDALLIGFFQSLAIIPGVSRSGITIASGLLVGLSRESATRFSFLLACPIVLGATALKIKEISTLATLPGGLYWWVGFGSSVLSGLLAIHYLLSFIKKHNFNLFIIYRIFFCLIIVSVFFSHR